jgi:hypothetical protein
MSTYVGEEICFVFFVLANGFREWFCAGDDQRLSISFPFRFRCKTNFDRKLLLWQNTFRSIANAEKKTFSAKIGAAAYFDISAFQISPQRN